MGNTNVSDQMDKRCTANELVLDANTPYLRLTSITPNSPEASLNLSPFFHFIVKVSPCKPNFSLERDFYQWVIENENKPVKLYMYNILEKKLEIKEITPNRNWKGADSLLGIKTRSETLSSAQSSIFRINGICRYDYKGFLVPREDFIIAAKDFVYSDLGELKSKIQRFGECQIMIYNLAKNHLREESLNLQGGQLGLEIGKGLLNDLDYNYSLFRKTQQNKRQSNTSELNSLKTGNEQIELVNRNTPVQQESSPEAEDDEKSQHKNENVQAVDLENKEEEKEDSVNEI
jgi:hypothetical protein